MRSWILFGLILLCMLAASAPAHAQGFGAGLSSVFAPPYPSIWQTTNSLVTMAVTNTTGETVLADLQVSIYRGGVLVGSTPPIPHAYGAANAFYPTYQITDWTRMGFTGEVRKSVDGTGRLPDGTYTVCGDFTNVRTASGAVLNTVQACTNYLVFFPKPPTLVFPGNGSIVSIPQPVFVYAARIRKYGHRSAGHRGESPDLRVPLQRQERLSLPAFSTHAHGRKEVRLARSGGVCGPELEGERKILYRPFRRRRQARRRWLGAHHRRERRPERGLHIHLGIGSRPRRKAP